MNNNDNRIKWIDGIRGILTIWLVLFHYSIAFINKGFIGFASNYPKEEFLNVFLNNLPFSLFINSSFPLYLFMLLIAFIPAYKYFNDHNEESIIRQARKRYLRFMIPTFLSFIICFIFYHLGLLMHVEAGKALGVNWIQQIMKVDHSFLNLLYEGLILAYVKGSQYVSTSWIIGNLFIGSYISYGVILLFGKMKKRTLVYIALFIFFFVYDQMYICYIMGIIAADIVSNKEFNNSLFISILLIILGLILAFIPDFILPEIIDVSVIAAIGACLLIIGVSGAKGIQHLLENKILYTISNYSFSSILIQIPIMAVISCRQYLIMKNMGIANNLIILSVFIVAIPVQILVTFLFQKLVVFVQSFVNKKVVYFN